MDKAGAVQAALLNHHVQERDAEIRAALEQAPQQFHTGESLDRRSPEPSGHTCMYRNVYYTKLHVGG